MWGICEIIQLCRGFKTSIRCFRKLQNRLLYATLNTPSARRHPRAQHSQPQLRLPICLYFVLRSNYSVWPWPQLPYPYSWLFAIKIRAPSQLCQPDHISKQALDLSQPEGPTCLVVPTVAVLPFISSSNVCRECIRWQAVSWPSGNRSPTSYFKKTDHGIGWRTRGITHRFLVNTWDILASSILCVQ